MIRVLLVDDHGLVRTGMKRLLDDTHDIEVVGEAETGEGAVAKAKETAPDVVLMDVTMPGIGGLEATRKLMRIDPDLKVIGVSVHVDGPFPVRMLEVGGLKPTSRDISSSPSSKTGRTEFPSRKRRRCMPCARGALCVGFVAVINLGSRTLTGTFAATRTS